MAIDTEERTSKSDKSKTGASEGDNQNSNKKAIKIVLIVVGVLIVLGILGTVLAGFLFKKGAETFIEQATGGQVKVDTGRGGTEVNIQQGDESLSTKAEELHKDFPKDDVPIYRGAKIVSSTSYAAADEKNHTAILSTKDSLDDVDKYYQGVLSSGGWKETLSVGSSNDKVLRQYTNESKQMTTQVSIDRDEDEDKTTIVLNVQSKE